MSGVPICERLRNDAVCQNRTSGADPLCIEAADTIEALVEALEPLALLFGDVNMNDPLSKWFRVGHLQKAADAIAKVRGGQP